MVKIICDPEVKHCGSCPGCVLNSTGSASPELAGYNVLPELTDAVLDLFIHTDFLELDSAGEYQWTKLVIDFANLPKTEAP